MAIFFCPPCPRRWPLAAPYVKNPSVAHATLPFEMEDDQRETKQWWIQILNPLLLGLSLIVFHADCSRWRWLVAVGKTGLYCFIDSIYIHPHQSSRSLCSTCALNYVVPTLFLNVVKTT